MSAMIERELLRVNEPLPTAAEQQEIEAREARRLRASEFLAKRAALIDGTRDMFDLHARNIAILNSFYHIDHSGLVAEGSGLPPGHTRLLHMGLLFSLHKYRVLWQHLPVDDPLELQRNPYFRLWGSVLNKYRVDRGAVFEPKMRKGVPGERDVVYAVHSHVDGPACLLEYLDKVTPFTFALMNCHDVVEEGLNVKKGLVVRDVDLKDYEKYETDNLGIKLQIGVPFLTESTYDTLVAECSQELLALYTNDPTLQAALSDFSARFPRESKRQEGKMAQNLLVRPPLVFGSLANQIVLGVEALNELADRPQEGRRLSPDQLRDVASSVVEVELADRMTDIATLERYVVQYKSDPEYGKYRSILYLCRLLNMYEKVSDVTYNVPRYDGIVQQLHGYIGLIEVKVEQINELLSQSNGVLITRDDVLSFYREVYAPIQKAADRVTTAFIERKVHNIVSAAVNA